MSHIVFGNVIDCVPFGFFFFFAKDTHRYTQIVQIDLELAFGRHFVPKTNDFLHFSSRPHDEKENQNERKKKKNVLHLVALS